ncbi:MAG: nicotinamide riboside transporter PnuC [Alphaproteobacteria bacterium]|nr:nicotinamide riboside transporter PnuC [Alphaproteobacteria bacterium]
MSLVRKNFDLVFFPAGIVALAAALHFLGIGEVSLLELGAVLGAVIARPLLKREKISGMILGIAANILFIFYFMKIHLTGQIILSAFYLALNFAGIYSWMRLDKKTHKLLRPTFLHPMWQAGVMIAIAAAVAVGAGTRGTIGSLDYFVMATGIIGMILLVRKKTDAWVSYIAGDTAGLALFWMSGSYLMLAAMLEYLYTDFAAFFKWRKAFRRIKKRNEK